MSQAENNKAVKTGMFIGLLLTLSLYFIAYTLVPQFDSEMMLAERIKLAIECLVLPAFFMLIMIVKIGAQRFGNEAEDPSIVKANTKGMKIDLCILSNTSEQVLIFIINTLALSVLLPFHALSLLPIYSGLFVVGRILFFLGYHYNVLWRAPGFAMAIIPAMAGILYCCFAVLT